MTITHSTDLASDENFPAIEPLLSRISSRQLIDWVQKISVPRHFVTESEQNKATADWLAAQFKAFGYVVTRHGHSGNVVASSRTLNDVVLVGAHFDSVPGSPGADDNGSAIAAMLGCAAALSGENLPVMFVAFNREEEGFIGSSEFVDDWQPPRQIICAHILEMLGYASSAPGSQKLPTGLPIRLRDTGDFLGLLANENSADAMQLILRTARACLPDFPVTGLEVVPGAERAFPVLARSDHVPFWEAKIPAVMWTDTAEFRNPHYHQPSDTPATLDYEFLLRVTKVLAATVYRQTRKS